MPYRSLLSETYLVFSDVLKFYPFLIPDEPDAPGKPKIVSYDRDRAELQWAEPVSDGGDAITGYTIERKEPKSSRWSRVNKSPILSTKFTVPGLIQGRQYHFRVIAENRAGPSQPSPESEVMTAKPEFGKYNLFAGIWYIENDTKTQLKDSLKV